MRASRKFAATALAGTLLATALATGASADTDTVEVTFVVTNTGALAVTAASGTQSLGSVDTTASETISGALPEITVSDTSNPFLGGWTVTVAATTLSDGAETDPVVIAGDKISYWSGAAVPGGVVLATGQQLLEANAVTLDTGRNAVVATAATGNNSATFTPRIKVDVTGVPAGTYSGDIVHSVTAS